MKYGRTKSLNRIILVIIIFCASFFLTHLLIQKIFPKKIQRNNKLEAKFSFDPNNYRLIIPTLINNHTYNFILDTGSTMSVVSQSLKSELGEYLHEQKVTYINGEVFDVSIYETPEQFQVGSYNLKGKIIYDETDKLERLSGSVGLLGVDFLKDFIVKIDYSDSTITIYKNHDINDIKSGFPIDFFYDSKRIPIVNSNISGIETKMHFDTGISSTSELSENIFQKITEQKKSDIFNIKKKLRLLIESEQTETFPAIIADLQLNWTKYENLTFSKHYFSGLGMDFLRMHQSVIFDFPNNKIYLSPRAKWVNNISIINLGIILENKDNEFIVKSIEKDGKAYQAGLRENDIIIKIEEYDMNIINLIKIQELLKDHKKNHIEILIKRSSENMVISCHL